MPVETWTDVLRPQAVDLLLLTLGMALALVSFFRKSERLKVAALVFAVGYLGFFKSHLLSVVDLFGVVDRNLPVFRYNITYYVFGGFVLVSTVLWGRLYCGRVCAFGALTQLMDKVLPARLRVDVPRRIERRAAWVKYGVLAAVLAYFLITRDLLVYRFVEPFWMFGLFGTWTMWIGLAALLVATVFVRNLYCRFFCPVGALLGIMSSLTVFKIKRWSECNTCKICERACEWGAIQGPTIIARECVRCDDCERLYADQKKCPHWIILLKPQRAAAKSSAPASNPSLAAR